MPDALFGYSNENQLHLTLKAYSNIEDFDTVKVTGLKYGNSAFRILEGPKQGTEKFRIYSVVVLKSQSNRRKSGPRSR